ncbi:MAG: DUF4160 domain-containing protein [Xanthomonadales bacterium]|nr:DUF4160 domain-containing protein [Xanthomonadales bacterium]
MALSVSSVHRSGFFIAKTSWFVPNNSIQSDARLRLAPLISGVRPLMNPYEELERRLRKATCLHDSAAVLCDLLSGGYSVWTDGSLYSIKQLVARVEGLQIHVYANEHAPPHFHVKGKGINASFTIQDCTLMHGDIGGRECRLVQWWFERSHPQIVAAWKATRPSDCTVGEVRE